MRLLVWVLIQSVWCPFKKRKFGYTGDTRDAHRGNMILGYSQRCPAASLRLHQKPVLLEP